MPRYFFDVHDGSTYADDTGTELLDLREAQIEAVRLSGALLKDCAATFHRDENWFVDVRDERGRVLLTLRFMAEFAA